MCTDYGESAESAEKPPSRHATLPATAPHSHYPANSMYPRLARTMEAARVDSMKGRDAHKHSVRESERAPRNSSQSSRTSLRGGLGGEKHTSAKPAPSPLNTPPAVEGRIVKGGMKLCARDFSHCCAMAMEIAFPDDGIYVRMYVRMHA